MTGPTAAQRPAERKDGAVPRYDRRFAAIERDSGIRKVSRLTWRAGLTGVACSALIGVAISHSAAGATGSSGRHSQPPPPHQQQQGQQQQGGIVVPAQPPQPSAGAGQVTSGAS
jgi:hypothetical protein